MRELFYLVGTEYRKILKRRSTWLGIAAVFLVLALNPIVSLFQYHYYEGEPVEKQREWTMIEKEAVERVSGPVDAGLLAQALSDERAYEEEKKTRAGDVDWYRDAYSSRMLPWDLFFEPLSYSGWTGSDIDGYYRMYDRLLEVSYQSELSAEDLADFIEASHANRPFRYGWMMAYRLFCNNQIALGYAVGFLVVFVLAGMFAGETTLRMDAMILSTRFGKNKVLLAKILCGVSFSLLAGVVASVWHFLVYGIAYGFEGADLPAQMYFPFCGWDMTVGQLCMITAGCMIFGALLLGCATMALSAYAKTPTPVLAIQILLLFVTMFFSVPRELHALNVLYDLLPGSVFIGRGYFDHVFRVGDVFAAGWTYTWPVWIVLDVLCACLAVRGYRRRQAG